MPNRRHFIAILILFLLFSTIAVGTRGQIEKVGVSKGDVFYYDYTTILSGNNIYSYLLAQGNYTQWVKVEITEVSASVVNMNIIYQYKNGTEFSFSDSIDVGALKCNSWIYPANLAENSVISDSQANQQYTVGDTVTRSYQGVQKEVDHITKNGDLEIYFEKTTGVLQEFDRKVDVNGNFTMELYYKIRLSSSVAEFNSILILPLVLIFTLLVAIFVKKRGCKAINNNQYA
jgi:hypothetical protein